MVEASQLCDWPLKCLMYCFMSSLVASRCFYHVSIVKTFEIDVVEQSNTCKDVEEA